MVLASMMLQSLEIGDSLNCASIQYTSGTSRECSIHAWSKLPGVLLGLTFPQLDCLLSLFLLHNLYLRYVALQRLWLILVPYTGYHVATRHIFSHGRCTSTSLRRRPDSVLTPPKQRHLHCIHTSSVLLPAAKQRNKSPRPGHLLLHNRWLSVSAAAEMAAPPPIGQQTLALSSPLTLKPTDAKAPQSWTAAPAS